ncbi:hypothetical protein ZEAMMB73_Zm00001d029261 [Zea mays]|uniref:Uncharacterized protein n=1 Tax=Zea mays TaxID=4577 RepID=A0A1D6K3Y2_MAIZE|nr:hypothetical protein ZEAMMB73_Zm00001d029261 [Zea mays]
MVVVGGRNQAMYALAQCTLDIPPDHCRASSMAPWQSGDGRSAAARWAWQSSGRGAPCDMRWTCSSSTSLATARCCPYIFTDIFNNDLGGPYAFLKPPFVQRSLLYMIQARRKKRFGP